MKKKWIAPKVKILNDNKARILLKRLYFADAIKMDPKEMERLRTEVLDYLADTTEDVD